MADDLASANVNRLYSLAASSIAIFTFTLFFLYPRYLSGEADALLFQATVVVMGVTTFSFVLASLNYYCASVGSRSSDAGITRYLRRGDRFWVVGYSLLFLAPTLILFSIGLLAVASVWLALWVIYLTVVISYFPKMRVAP
jgi:hypothetical protein